MPPKTSSRIKNRKLTDFFHQPSSASVLPSATSSAPSTTTSVTRRPMTRASKVMVEDERTHSSAPPQMRNVSTASRKRACSPDAPIDTSKPAPSPTKRKSPKKRMRVFGPDPDAEKPTAVVYVMSPSRNGPAQRPASTQAHSITLSVTSPTDSSKEVVYSSQSDEVELVLPAPESRDLGKVVEGVRTWRRKTFQSSTPSPLRVREDALQVDPSSSSLRCPPLIAGRCPSLQLDVALCSAEISKRSATPQTPLDASTCLPSPPDTKGLLPLPATPKSLDPVTKTAKIIAEIQAKARAAALSSDEEETLVYRELDDSDDDELMDALLIGGSKKQSARYSAPRKRNDIFSSPLSSVPSAFNDPAMSPYTSPDGHSPPTRRSLRIHKVAPSFRLPMTAAIPSTSVGVTKLGSSSHHKKSQAKNPLQTLLREKERQDKRGAGGGAFRRAEEITRQGSCEASVGSGDELGTMDQLSLTDEQAAWKAVHESWKSTSPADADDVEDFTVGDRESKILGSGAGEAINKILTGDQDSKKKAKVQTKQKVTSGVPLWVWPSDADMVVDSVSTPPLSGHPILTFLDESFKSGDITLVDLVLCAGALAIVPPKILMSNMSQILVLTLLGSSQVSNAVGVALRDLWELNPRTVHMPFTAILFALLRLGASPSILGELGLRGEYAPENTADHAALPEALKRLLAIVRTAAFAGAFARDDVADVVLSLLLVGLDPSTSDNLRTQLNITIDAICNHGATDYLLHGIHEKVLNLAARLAPVDKARLISFFASSGGRTRCIAHRLAYSLLISTPMGPKGKIPSLEPLILFLSPEAGSCELFDVTNESTDYEVLGHYVNILSVALHDIMPYVEEERAINTSASNTLIQGSPGKPKKPPVPPLELLCRVLELLQSKIVDTRAAHLDRSRTKAAIQRLTMRIRYDRMAHIGIRPRQRASTLKAYFSPQRR